MQDYVSGQLLTFTSQLPWSDVFNKKTNIVLEQDIGDEHEMRDIDLSRWDSNNYLMRQDELEDSVEILNAISHTLHLPAVVLPSHYHNAAPKLRDVVWAASDEALIDSSGKVSS